MLCCLLAIAFASPLGVILARFVPRRDCCGRMPVFVAVALIAVIALAAWAALLLWPASFRHICSFPAA